MQTHFCILKFAAGLKYSFHWFNSNLQAFISSKSSKNKGLFYSMSDSGHVCKVKWISALGLNRSADWQVLPISPMCCFAWITHDSKYDLCTYTCFLTKNKGIHIIFKTVTFHYVSYHSLQTLWLIRYRLESRNSIKGAFGINSLFIFGSIPDASAVLIINRLAISEIKTQESTKFATLVQLLHINVHEKEPGSCLTTGSSYLLFTIASGSNVLARDCFVLKTQLRAFWITSDTASQRKGKSLT